ncbi:MAG: YjbQ family protein [Bacteroidetes bacterium]|nr:YjbQ family protein [Bacteroidota bacterium]
MTILQKTITLRPRARGFHLVTGEILEQLPELRNVHTGLAHIHILHTSASLTLNENADPTVRGDFERWFDRVVPENASYYRHTSEGPDDMPAHLKASLLGSGVLVPVRDGRFHLGTWQGIYLGEHREHGGARRIVVTVLGE